MKSAVLRDYESTPDDLVRAVLYPFCMADYDGDEAIRGSAVRTSDVLDGRRVELVNEALSAAQEAGLIEQVEDRPGAIAMTLLGKKKFLLVRDDFLDDEVVVQLRDELKGIDLYAMLESQAYRHHKQTCTALAVFPEQPCPVSGRWVARRLDQRQCALREGDPVPLPELDENDDPVFWYLMKT
ncbi:hypothetical protein HBH1_01454 [Herbaspirillum sp. BH-1]|uniref:Uncharacterized protein n=1 Tax=Herbaspirillum frisingense TaxID=92645 RepID=A0ABU1PBB6_9BURK|nr:MULTISPECIES: hypothetical protein [Herbaspirillum]MDR6583221.1 hypothetical protein [Herbaspirillum frisingense]PLY60135.1 hypothetical protein HBH1_01454 [Herbaspirillum sp. BH-1]